MSRSLTTGPDLRPSGMRALVSMVLVCGAWAQGGPPLAFEAASVKINNSGGGDSHSSTRPANVRLTNLPLRAIIAQAYEVKDYQLTGPEWLASSRYDVVAKAALDTPDKDIPAMLRTLLIERFKLQTHRETRDLPVYALVPARNGFKLKPVEPGSSSRDTSHTAMGGVLTATKTNMDRLAQWLSRFTDRPVVDMTGIPGVFDFTLQYSLERENSKAEPNEAAKYPIVPLAIEEQLGLRLEKRTSTVEMLAIDRAEKVPIEN
jgi:uncharacterized protein (TIGR03435 family)